MSSPKRARTLSDVYFWKAQDEHGWMSNWSSHAFEDEEGTTFATAEHWLMHQKALLMGDRDTAANILKVTSPAVAKKLGRRVKHWDEQKWADARFDLMVLGLLLKIKKHPELAEKLKATGEARIAEASPFDAIWGIGLSPQDAKSGRAWRGSNLLGEAWQKVRSELL